MSPACSCACDRAAVNTTVRVACRGRPSGVLLYAPLRRLRLRARPLPRRMGLQRLSLVGPRRALVLPTMLRRLLLQLPSQACWYASPIPLGGAAGAASLLVDSRSPQHNALSIAHGLAAVLICRRRVCLGAVVDQVFQPSNIARPPVPRAGPLSGVEYTLDWDDGDSQQRCKQAKDVCAQ